MKKESVLDISPISNLYRLYTVARIGAIFSGIAALFLLLFILYNFYAPYRFDRWQKDLDHTHINTVSAKKNADTSANDFIMDGDQAGQTGSAGESSSGSSENSSVDSSADLPISKFSLDYLAFPTELEEYVSLKKELLSDPSSEELKNKLRSFDLFVRQQYFHRRSNTRTGGLLLLTASVLCFVFLGTAKTIKRKIPGRAEETAQKNSKEYSILADRQKIFGFLILILVLIAGISIGSFFPARSELELFLADQQKADLIPTENTTAQESLVVSDSPAGIKMEKVPVSPEPSSIAPKATEAKGTASPSGPSVSLKITGPDPEKDRAGFLEEWKKNWASFRGPFGNGLTEEKELDKNFKPSFSYPVQWNMETKENILWSVKVPLEGHNSPIIWGDRLFVSGGNAKERKVFCFHTKDGALLWETIIPISSEGKIQEEQDYETGSAASTLAADGSRVYAIFSNGDLAAVDFSGKLVWSKGFGVPENHYGYSASLALWFDRIIVQIDIDAKKGDKKTSRLLAIKGKDGSILWDLARKDSIGSWSSPIVHSFGDQWQLLVMGDPFFAGYDPENGKELWRYTGFNTDVAPSPITDGKTIFAAHTTPGFVAFDSGSKGEISESEDRFWTAESSGLPNTCCPIQIPDMIMLLAENGSLTGIDLKKKSTIWELFVDEADSFYASPVYAGGKLYLFAKTEEAPNAYVIDTSKLTEKNVGKDALDLPEIKGALLGKYPLPEPVSASPALHEGKIYIRGKSTLWCIGSQTKQ
ncbi:MAG: PQQ-binding-like beta-propeller repeat protein [Planctomycetia bacterium]|nr:PQQ-binding-like beta-propeller repeat protein [Planctomycetia bacterium]